MKILFKVKPVLIGEILVIFCILVPCYIKDIKTMEIIILAMLGTSIIVYKTFEAIKYIRILENGVITIATIIGISKTDLIENERTVNHYTFKYKLKEEVKYCYYYSAYDRHLKIGDKYKIIVDKAIINKVIIPKLEGLNI